MRSLPQLSRGARGWCSLQAHRSRASFATLPCRPSPQSRASSAGEDAKTLYDDEPSGPGEDAARPPGPSVLQRLKHAKDDVRLAEREQRKKEEGRLKAGGRARGEWAHLPPPLKEHTYAKSEEEIEHSGADYTPAESAGLPVVGGLDDWWMSADRWNAMKMPKVEPREFFPPKEKVRRLGVLTVTLRRILVEALALRYQCPNEPWAVTTWSVKHTSDVLDRIMEVRILVDDNGEATLAGPVPSMSRLLKTAGHVKGRPTVTRGRAVKILNSHDWGSIWLQVSLRDINLKFAIRKRLYQLTGHLISDNDLYNMVTVGNIYEYIVKPDPPKTVVKALRRDHRNYIIETKLLKRKGVLINDKHQYPSPDGEDVEEAEVGGKPGVHQEVTAKKSTPPLRTAKLATGLPPRQKPLRSLPNVKVHFRQVTRADRDKAVGRLKLIKRELRQRNLPATPRQLRLVPRGNEADWVMGK